MTKQTIGLLIAVIVLPLACLGGGLTLMSSSDETPDQETAASQAAVTLTATPAISLPAEVADLKTAFVIINTGDYPQVSHIPMVYTVTHGDRMWVELSPENYVELKAAGIGVQLDREGSLHPVTQKDPLIQEPVVHPDLTSDEIPGVKDFYLIQMRGHQTDEWLSTLEAYGADGYLRYFGGEMWRAWITPEEAVAISELDFVRWVGPYHPEFRISSNLTRHPMKETPNLIVIMYDDGYIDDTISAIEAIGGQFVSRFPSIHPSTVRVRFELVPRSIITPTAQQKHVLWLESWVESYIE